MESLVNFPAATTTQFKMQIDVKQIDASKNFATCNLYTGERCVKIFMSVTDYENLLRDGFFIRDGKERDSADVLNTTLTYYPKKDNALMQPE